MIELLMPEEKADAFLKEVRAGVQLKASFQQIREAACAKIAQAAKGHKTIDGLGKHVGEIPQHEFFLLEQKYPGCWEDREFVKEFFRREKHLASNSL